MKRQGVFQVARRGRAHPTIAAAAAAAAAGGLAGDQIWELFAKRGETYLNIWREDTRSPSRVHPTELKVGESRTHSAAGWSVVEVTCVRGSFAARSGTTVVKRRNVPAWQ